MRTSQELDFHLSKTSKNNCSEIHVSWPTPWDYLSVLWFYLDYGLYIEGHLLVFTHQMQKMKDVIGHNMRKNYYLPAMYE